MNKRIALVSLAGVIALVVSFSLAHAFFASGATNMTNTFSAAASFPTATPSATPTPTSTQSATHIVISEVQINGGPSHSDYDFIELYNPTNNQIDINGFRLVSRTGNSSSDDLIKSFTSVTIVPAHGFYLWASNHDGTFPSSIGANASTSAQLTSSMSIALRNGANDTGVIVDALSWNNGATIGEGTNASPPGGGQSLERKAYATSTQATMEGGVDSIHGNGFDSNNNATDFILRNISQPQNSASAIELP